MDIHLKINDREFNFQMNFDQENPADRHLYSMFYKGMVPEMEVFNLMFHALAPGDTVIDCGANVGMFTIFMKQMVGDTGTVVAFEPSQGNYDKLKKNLDVNNAQVLTYCTALSDHKSALDWYESWEDTGQAGLSPLVHGMKPVYKVETTTLDSVVDIHPRLIKIDCEGAEERILHGAEKMLRRGVPFVVCELANENLARFNSNQHQVRHYMRWLGYDTWMLRQDGLLPILVPEGMLLQSNVLNFNVLFATQLSVANLWRIIDVHRYLA